MIASKTTSQYWRFFDALPPSVQHDARKAYRRFRDDPFHPGLRFKRLQDQDDLYSVRIGLAYRVVGFMKKGHIVWFWIGRHSDFDRVF